MFRLVKLTECQAHHPELLSANPPSPLELELALLLEAHKSDNERLGKKLRSKSAAENCSTLVSESSLQIQAQRQVFQL